MKLVRYVGVAVLASLVGLGSAGGAQGCTVTLTPGQSIQEAINGANQGAVICLAAGEWKESLSIEKSLTLRAVEVKPEPDVVIQSAKEGWPVILIRSEEPIEVVLQGLRSLGRSGGVTNMSPRGSALMASQSTAGPRW